MASESEKGIHDDPNFAIICSFLNNYGSFLQFPDITFNALRSYIESSNRKVHRILEDIFIRLLRRWKGRCAVDAWEKVLVNFCYTYSQIDAWELEKFGFQRCSVAAKMRMLKNLLETQFDCNTRFKDKVSEKPASDLRLQPIGRDKNGLAYWFFVDKDNNARVYTEEQDGTEESESWQIVAKDKPGIIALVNNLKELKEAPSRSVTPSVSGSGCVTPVISSRSATPANIEGDSQVKEELEVKQEIKEEAPDLKEVKPEVKVETEMKVKPESLEVKEEIKEEIKEEVADAMDKMKTETLEAAETECKDESKEKGMVEVESTKTHTESLADKTIEDASDTLVQNEKHSENSEKTVSDETVKHSDTEKSSENNDIKDHREKTEDLVSSANGVDIVQTLEKDNNKDCETINVCEEIENKESPSQEELPTGQVEEKRIKETETWKNESETNVVENKTKCEESESKVVESETNDVDENKSQTKSLTTKNDTNDHENVDKSEITNSEEKREEVVNCDAEKVTKTCSKLGDKLGKASTCEEAKDDKKEKSVDSVEEKKKNAAEKTTGLTEESKTEKLSDKSPQISEKITPRGKGRRGKRRLAAKKSPPTVPVTPSDEQKPKQRKRKRGYAGSDSEGETRIPEKINTECEKQPPGGASVKSESDLSETPPVSGNESKEEECTPSKRRRDKFLKKRKPVKESDSDSTDESAEPEKKPKKVSDENETTIDSAKVSAETKDPESTAEDDPGSQQENCPKKCGKRKEEDGETQEVSEEAPTSKKGRPSSQSRGGRKKKAPVEIPMESLRRSSRATRGVRRFEASVVSDSPRRKNTEKEAEPEKVKPRDVKPKLKAKKDLDEEKENREIEQEGGRKKKRSGKQTTEVFDPKDGKKSRKSRAKRDETDEEENEEEELFHEDEDSEPLRWSSPSETEYEVDSDGEVYRPTGRNARRQEKLKSCGVAENNDTPCCKCGKYDHPEWILLCDSCDAGYHTGCLRPPLMLIPDGDWFCPPCEHSKLIVLLLERLNDVNQVSKGNERLQRRRERLKFVGISLDNILTDQDQPRPRKRAVIASSSEEEGATRENSGGEEEGEDPDLYDNGAWETLKDKERRDRENRQRDIQKKYYYDWGQRYVDKARSYSGDSESTEVSSSSEGEEEEEYSMVANRSRRERKQINYNFNDFDEIIKSAIKEETECPAGRGGKSMKAIVAVNNRAYSDEEEEQQEEEVEEDESWKGQGKDMRNIEAAIAKEKKEEEEEEEKQEVTETQDNDENEGENAGDTETEPQKEEDEEEAEPTRPDVFKNRPSHPLVAAKAKRKKNKRLTALSDDDDEDNDTDEYKVSDEEGSDDAYQEEEEDLSEESCYGNRKHGRYKSASRDALRRSTRRRRVLREMADFVVDEEDSEEERSHRAGRRTTRRKRYGDDNFSDEESVDSEFYSDNSFESRRRKKKNSKKSSSRKSSTKKRKRKMKFEGESDGEASEDAVPRQRKSSTKYEEDSDYNLSDESGCGGRGGRRRAASKRINYREMAGSGSEGESPKRKKKGKLDVSKFVKDNDPDEENEESNTDDYLGDENDQGGTSGGMSDESGPRYSKKSDKIMTQEVKKQAKKRSRIQIAESSTEEELEERKSDLEKDSQGQSDNDTAKTSATLKKKTEKINDNVRNGSKPIEDKIPKDVTNSASPTTYVFKARVNGCDTNNTQKSTNQMEAEKRSTKSNIRPSTKETLVNGDESDESNADIDGDDLEDIGDIVAYITQDGE